MYLTVTLQDFAFFHYVRCVTLIEIVCEAEKGHNILKLLVCQLQLFFKINNCHLREHEFVKNLRSKAVTNERLHY